jgi:hypothetical protein
MLKQIYLSRNLKNKFDNRITQHVAIQKQLVSVLRKTSQRHTKKNLF